MKKKEQLRRELIQAKTQIRDLEDKLKGVCNSWKSSDEIVRRQEKVIQQLRDENHDMRDKWNTALEEAKNASARAAQLMYINDVLCAELKDCDRCIDTVRMALEQKSARAELLNRITGPLV